MVVWRIRSVSSTILTAAVLALTLAGCADNKSVVPVRGKVFFRGKPAVGALVIFNPVGGESDLNGVKPQATVGDDGSFEVSTYGEKDGAPAGEYAVTFVWMIDNPKNKKQQWSPLPLRLMHPEQSGVRITVREEGPNELQPFQLTN